MPITIPTLTSPNVTSSGTIKELKAAIEINNVEKVIALLKSPSAEIKANIAADHNYVLRWVAIRGDLAVVYLLLEFPDVVADIAANGNYTLIWAATNGHIDIVNRLLEFPDIVANVAASNNSALRGAAAYGHLTVVNRLLEFPAVAANIAASDNDALKAATVSGHLAVVYRLLEFPDVIANSPLIWATKNGHLALVNRLLEFPDIVANITADNSIALRWAVDRGHLAVVNRLFAAMRPADINIAIELQLHLARLYENFKKETGELFHKMVGVLSGLKQKKVPIDLGAFILSQAMPTPYLTRANVGIEKARKSANEHLANLPKYIKMKDDNRSEQKRP